MKKSRILVADDDPSVRQSIGDLLRRHMLVMVAENGEDAFEKAQQVTPDAVLLDLTMPGWPGPETILRFRTTSKLRDVPILVLTGDDRLGELAAARMQGANDHVSKEAIRNDPQTLFGKLRALLADDSFATAEVVTL